MIKHQHIDQDGSELVPKTLAPIFWSRFPIFRRPRQQHMQIEPLNHEDLCILRYIFLDTMEYGPTKSGISSTKKWRKKPMKRCFFSALRSSQETLDHLAMLQLLALGTSCCQGVDKQIPSVQMQTARGLWNKISQKKWGNLW